MPKRAPSPTLSNDTLFFTVINPYPEQPYVTMQDSTTFARWIACIIGYDHLLAFYHKPKSPNVVIVETANFGSDSSLLVGEHRWSELLRTPDAREVKEVSYIFPSTLRTHRAMEKDGKQCGMCEESIS
ncbi:hypothetical protein BD413DRAFT_481924 [Trametes elegans]|nr:hypothetical protein BD413DRAFT_481924 [Trametes elegans]